MNDFLGVLFTPFPPLPVALEAPAVAPAGSAVTTGIGPTPSPLSRTDRARKRARGEATPIPANASTTTSADTDIDAAASSPPKQQDGEVQTWEGRGASATFSAKLVAAEALSGLVRVGAESAPRGAAAAVITAPGETGGSRRGRRSGGESGASAGKGAGGEAALLAHEVVMSEAARRAGSGWAWERELAFVLMEACGGRRAGMGGGGPASLR